MINAQVDPEFKKQLDVAIDSLRKLNSINALIGDGGNNIPLPFICPPILEYDDISKTETLEEKTLKLKARLADLEIKRLESKNKGEYELRVKIEDLKCTIKTLEGSNERFDRNWGIAQKIKQVTDLQKFKDLYDELEVEYTFNGNCIWLRQNEKNIIGNDNCKSVIYFDRKGRFVQQGFFE